MKKMTLQVMLFVAGLLGVASGCNGQSINKSKKATSKATTCSHCGNASCDKNCSSNYKTTTMTDSSRLKSLVPSCNLSGSEMVERKNFLQSTMSKKIAKVEELETGYDLIFNEPKEYSQELLKFINFERGCCSSFSYALIFEPNNKATHLQIYGSKEIKTELAKGFKELGLLK
jgi:hypothetical protein